MTTVYSWQRNNQQDQITMRNELHSAIQEAASLFVQNAEFMVKYKNDMASMGVISTAENRKNIILARQAYVLTKALGSSATSLDLSGAAEALINSQDFLLAEELLKTAADRAHSANEYYAALRVLSGLQYNNGKRGESAESFKKVLEVFSKFPEEANNEQYVATTQVYSYIYMANAIGASDCALSRHHLASVEQYLSKLPQGSAQTNTLRAQAQKISELLVANCK
jgi:hypothetical protein